MASNEELYLPFIQDGVLKIYNTGIIDIAIEGVEVLSISDDNYIKSRSYQYGLLYRRREKIYFGLFSLLTSLVEKIDISHIIGNESISYFTFCMIQKTIEKYTYKIHISTENGIITEITLSDSPATVTYIKYFTQFLGDRVSYLSILRGNLCSVIINVLNRREQSYVHVNKSLYDESDLFLQLTNYIKLKNKKYQLLSYRPIIMRKNKKRSLLLGHLIHYKISKTNDNYLMFHFDNKHNNKFQKMSSLHEKILSKGVRGYSCMIGDYITLNNLQILVQENCGKLKLLKIKIKNNKLQITNTDLGCCGSIKFSSYYSK